MSISKESREFKALWQKESKQIRLVGDGLGADGLLLCHGNHRILSILYICINSGHLINILRILCLNTLCIYVSQYISQLRFKREDML
jgi:hypothetical protein